MGALSLDKLEAMTCVCSVGLDMIAIPGDTPAATISGIIADEAAIGMINAKPPLSADPGIRQGPWRVCLLWRTAGYRAHYGSQSQ